MDYSEITEPLKERYRHELRRLHHHRGSYMLVVAVVLFLSFSLLDTLLVPLLFLEFLQYRLSISALCILLFFLNYKDVDYKYPNVLTFVAYFFSLFILSLMVVRMGGVTSPYFAGFIVAIVIYTSMVPLTMLQTLISGCLGVGCYLFAILYWCPLQEGQESILINNVFFMSSFVLLVAVQNGYETRARLESFLLRMEEEKTADQLNIQAGLLEQEVARRSEEHQRTEDRFRLLFEHIVDDVILVSETGRILYANSPFYEHLALDKRGKINLTDLVGIEDRLRLRGDLLTPVARGEVVNGYQTRLYRTDGESFDVEINGNKLERQGKVLGLQLIIRDISMRKQMEQELRRSLQVRKQTENATIMALARLSEHRDITPYRHLARIREYSRLLAEELAGRPEFKDQLGGNVVSDLSMGSVLHDIGKVGIPDTVLFKRGPLTNEELDLIRQHTVFGGDVIKSMETPDETSGFLESAKNIAYFHHEKWDGSGYPFGLVGQEIPLAARIVALADAYEAMTSSRQYDRQLSHQQAMHAVIQEVNSHFDPSVVDAFLAREQDFEHILSTLGSFSGIGNGGVGY
ncbi:MAG TPA: PAS domain S-box protein [Desulfobulbus sp.]|nr:PAS domain S-box protein [Desulfobulbus sp.]